MGDNEDDEMDNALSWGTEDSLRTGCARRMMREGVPELIFLWVGKATRRIMAQHQQAFKTGFVFSMAPQCMGPTAQFNDA